MIQDINDLIQGFEYVISLHIRRTNNKEVDFLENWGCLHLSNNIDDPLVSETQEEGLDRWIDHLIVRVGGFPLPHSKMLLLLSDMKGHTSR